MSNLKGKPLNMAEKKGSGGVINVRSKDTFFAPPGLLGYNHLTEPDKFVNDLGMTVKNFKMNIHYTDAQMAALVARIQKHVIDMLWEKFLAEADEMGQPKWSRKVKGKTLTDDWPAPVAQEWVDTQSQDPREGSKFSDPYIRFQNGAEYKDKKTGELKLKTMRANDAVSGSAIDVKKAKLGMGSIVQPVLTASIYYSPALATCVDGPAISVKLQGLRIFKLVQWVGSSQSGSTEVSDEDMELLGQDVKAEDLSAYVKGKPEEDKEAAKVSPTGEEYAADDMDEDLPF